MGASQRAHWSAPEEAVEFEDGPAPIAQVIGPIYARAPYKVGPPHAIPLARRPRVDVGALSLEDDRVPCIHERGH